MGKGICDSNSTAWSVNESYCVGRPVYYKVPKQFQNTPYSRTFVVPKGGGCADPLSLFGIRITHPTIQGGLRSSFRVIHAPHHWEKRSRVIYLSRTQVCPEYQSASDDSWWLALVSSGGRVHRMALPSVIPLPHVFGSDRGSLNYQGVACE